MRIRRLIACFALLCGCLTSQLQAALVNWNIDPNRSWIRLNVADQLITIGPGQTLPAALRDQTNGGGAAPSWTDAGKRLAGVTGTLSTNMTANSITFNAGSHVAPATASGLWRPDAASWNGTTFNTAAGATTPSVFAADLTVGGGFVVAFLNFYNVNTDYAGTATGLANFAGSGSGALTVGSLGNSLDLDALALISDSRTTNLGSFLGAANLGGNASLNIANLGGLNRELDLQYSGAQFTVLINGLPVIASYDSRIVATATVPEPTSISLLGLGLAVVAVRRRRRGTV